MLSGGLYPVRRTYIGRDDDDGDDDFHNTKVDDAIDPCKTSAEHVKKA